MTIHHDNQGPPEAADPIDAFFDSQADEATTQRLAAALRSDVRTAGDFVRTQRMVSMFKEPVEGPDLTDAILRRLQQRQRFSARLRSARFGGKLAAGVGLALGALALWAIDRYAPRTAAPAPAPAVVNATAPRSAPAVAPQAAAPTIAARAVAPYSRLKMGTLDIRTLPNTSGNALIVITGSGGNTRLPALPSTAWAAAARPDHIEWSPQAGEPVLAIPALGARSSLIKLPANH
jgi:hypothetical protein